jgi:hypothetical protein
VADTQTDEEIAERVATKLTGHYVIGQRVKTIGRSVTGTIGQPHLMPGWVIVHYDNGGVLGYMVDEIEPL